MIGAPAALRNAVSDALVGEVAEQWLPPFGILEHAGVVERRNRALRRTQSTCVPSPSRTVTQLPAPTRQV